MNNAHTGDSDTGVPNASPHPNSPAGVCPVDHETRQLWLKQHIQQHQQGNQGNADPNTEHQLSDEREISTIPRTNSSSNWVYPSEHQFYASMQRKGLVDANEENYKRIDMKSVIPIHNQINERVWNIIKRNWEPKYKDSITLTSFQSFPKKVTPRAWIRSRLLGMDEPFDRHDWIIDRNGKRVDYVIDFYYNEKDNVYFDVRPKLNSFEGCRLRLFKFIGL